MRKLMSLTALALAAALHPYEAELSSHETAGAASAVHGPRCRKVSAPGTGESTTEGCTSPFGCVNGQIDRGLLRGTFFATVDMIAPSAGMPTHEPPSMLSLSVTRVFSPDRGGTLTLHSTGVFDTTRGLGAELSLVTGGTGHWEGATGHLFVNTQAASATTFEGVMVGTICLP